MKKKLTKIEKEVLLKLKIPKENWDFILSIRPRDLENIKTILAVQYLFNKKKK